MNGFFAFAGDHPWQTFFLAFLVGEYFYRLIMRFFRLVIVMVRGWPPSHLDADGDWRPESSDDGSAP